MKATITARHLEMTDELRTLIERRLDKLERHLPDKVVSAQVIATEGRHERHIEVVLHMRGDHVLRGDGRAPAWSPAVSAAADKVEQQAQTVTGKWEARRRRATPLTDPTLQT